MDSNTIKLFGSKLTDNYATPKWLYELLNAAFEFDYDPCPLNSTFDGLLSEWKGNIFVNPPYSLAKEFLKKADEEFNNGNIKTIVILIFANTHTKFFHDYIYGKYKIVPIEGRLRFNDGKNSAMRPSILCIRKQN